MHWLSGSACRGTADGFFTSFPSGGDDIRERIAAHLDAALFESVLASEVRALGTSGADLLFDLLSQFISRVFPYRWLAVTTSEPQRMGLHANPARRTEAESEARAALGVAANTALISVEDDDASDEPTGEPVIVRPIELGNLALGKMALAPLASDVDHARLFNVIARELAGPTRMAMLVEEAQRLATQDALTSLNNRRAFTAALEHELACTQRYGNPVSLVLFDVDHFKKVNDLRGHPAGDAVLAGIGRHLKTTLRKTNIDGRWGGEEFVVALFIVYPSSVFNYDASYWAVAIHALFVVLESVAACFVARSFFDNVIGLERIVKARTDDMKRILDNVDQGFVGINRDGTLTAERSAVLDTWMGPHVAECTFAQALQAVDPAAAAWFSVAWEEVFADVMPLEITLDQLPRQISDGRSTWCLEYKPIFDGAGALRQVLLVMSDVTSILAGERAQAAQRELMDVFLRITRDRRGFEGFLDESNALLARISDGNTGTEGIWRAVHRQRHNLRARQRRRGVPLRRERHAPGPAWPQRRRGAGAPAHLDQHDQPHRPAPG